jgi:hypothetical protein
MHAREIGDFRLELLDLVHELSQDPVGAAEAVRERVNEFFGRLEASIGEEAEGS